MNRKTKVIFAVLVSMVMLLPIATFLLSPNSLAESDGESGTDTAAFGDVRFPGEDNVPIPPVAVIGDILTGYKGTYFNLPADHPDVEGAVTGVVTGDSPFNHDWYDPQYFSFSRIDPNLTFGNGFFPVDSGLPGDPNYFSVCWQANITVPESDNYSFLMGSDDDSWLYIDGTMVIDLGGIHALSEDTGTVYLEPGIHSLALYFAERHLTESGFYFKFMDPRVDVAHTVIWDDIQAEAGTPVFLKGSCSYDADGSIQAYSWDFGDGIEGNGADATHTYSRPGTYTVTLTVADADGLTGTDTCIAIISGESVDLYVESQDILLEPSPALMQESKISTAIHCYDPYPGPGADCTVEVYLDRIAEANLLVRQSNVHVPANSYITLEFGWTPTAEGSHVILTMVKDSVPIERDVENNTASLPIFVSGISIPVTPSLEYWIEYINQADTTLVCERGILFYASGAFPESMHGVQFNDTYRIPESDYGLYPLYNRSMPCTFRLHIANLDNISHTGINVTAIHEFHNTVTVWDSLGAFDLVQGQQIPGTPPNQWTLDLAPNQEVVVTGYHFATGRGWGLDQIHLLIMWNGTTLIDNPVASVYCPPP